MACAVQNAVDMTIRAHEHAVLIPEDSAAAQLPELTRPAGRARISLLSQLGKSSLAMEVDAGVLGGRVLAALRAERWRTAAEGAMRNPSRATGESLAMRVHCGAREHCVGPLHLPARYSMPQLADGIASASAPDHLCKLGRDPVLAQTC